VERDDPILAEQARVEALRRHGILDRPASPDLDALTRLATYVTGAGAAAINLIDDDRVWQASAVGVERGEHPRADVPCARVFQAGETVHVRDATGDPRFAGSPFVDGRAAEIGLYASTPLRDRDGFLLGTLCVIDALPGELDRHQLTALEDLGRQVEHLFELHRQSDELTGLLAELDHQAGHDPLTGLANRRRFTDELRTRLGGLDGEDGPLTLVALGDLDGFKAINDRFGHAAGDAVLQVIAERLTAVTREDDLVARLGGDEFAVLCPDLGADDAPAVAERLRAAVARPIDLEGTSVRVGLSLGTATTLDGVELEALLMTADRRMYADKGSAR
jgi:diguanylate cyclase (GGDEF)-like protein